MTYLHSESGRTMSAGKPTRCPDSITGHDEGDGRDGKCTWCGQKFKRAQDRRITAHEQERQADTYIEDGSTLDRLDPDGIKS